MISYNDESIFVANHTYGTWRPQKGWKKPLYITKAEGVYFYDDDNNKYMDLSSQLMCSNLGHGNKKVAEAICEQAKKIPYIAPSYICDITVKTIESLLTVVPAELDQFFFSPSGTEANEAAILMLRQYMSPKYKIISRYRSYHGATTGGINLTGDPRRWFIEPANKIPGVIFAPDAYCYRCSFGMEYPNCGIACAKYIDYMIKEEGNVAAIFVEPVVGTNGIIVPPDGYLQLLRKIADENGVLLIVDEVMSGWFRTGKWFAFQHWDIIPDIITTAKGCSSAYTPVGITITRSEIKDFFNDRFFPHGHTYSGHPLTLSAIPATIDEYIKLEKSGIIKRVSIYLEKKLKELKTRHVSIGDVRGIGHFWAIEIVKNRKTKEPFNTKEDKALMKPLMTDKIAGEAFKLGVYINTWYNHFTIAPPLIITEKEIDKAVSVLDEVLKIADNNVKGG